VTLFDDFGYGAESKLSGTGAEQLEKESRKKGAKGESDEDEEKK
jgi:hypothetical protein